MIQNRTYIKSKTTRIHFPVVLVLAVFVLLFSSCLRDEFNTFPAPPDGTSGNKVTFFISVPKSSLPSTRSIAEGGVADNQVDSVTILLFDKNDDEEGLYRGFAKATAVSTPNSGDLARKSFTVVLPDGEFDALVIANANYIFDALLKKTADITTKDMAFFRTNLTATIIEKGASGYVKWNADPADAGFKPFPMAGHYYIPADRTSSLGTIFLSRMLAKVNVKLEKDYPVDANPNDIYRIEAIQVRNYNRTGNLISQKELSSETVVRSVFNDSQLNIPANPGYVDDADSVLTCTYSGGEIEKFIVGTDLVTTKDLFNYQCVDQIFLPEVLRSANAQNATCLLIQVYVPSLQELRWFRVNFRMPPSVGSDPAPVNLQRNFSYTVRITDIKGNGFVSSEEAYNALPEGMTTIIDAVDESDMNDITFDGRNELTVNKSLFVFYPNGGNQELKIFTDYIHGWKIEEINASWITYPTLEGAAGTTIPTNLSCGANPGGTLLTGTITITAGALRKTIQLIQAPTVPLITDAKVTGFTPYIGAFWKANQTGERLIRMPRPTDIGIQAATDGDWAAIVLEGRDWIQLDTVMTADKNVGWRTGATESSVADGNDVGFDARYTVMGDRDWVSGEMVDTIPQIYFRIGLNSQFTSTEDKPARYGVILLAYNNYTKLQRIWVRQGENDDYVFRPTDPVTTGGFTERTNAVRFSVYNLTARSLNQPVRATYRPDRESLEGYDNPTVLTEYPTQPGAFFQWSATGTAMRKAWDYTTPTSPGWVSFNPPKSDVWDVVGVDNETCPEGYRRPNVVRTDIPDDNMSVSEIHQSLYENPKNGGGPIVEADRNNATGYYADGFFDRREITSSLSGIANSSVSVSSDEVGYVGQLVYNTNNFASLFFPGAGGRGADGVLAGTGSESGTYLTTGRPLAYPGVWTFATFSTYQGSYNDCTPVRCVVDPEMGPPTPPKTPVEDILDVPLTDDNSIIPYIGAFWKDDQTGERLIHMDRPTTGDVTIADGKWTAQVLVGRDWIRLDTQPSTDSNIGWITNSYADPDMSGNDPAFDAAHPVESDKTWVRGVMSASTPRIYFRIGLTSELPTAAPRYGVVLLTYKDNTRSQRIWIRQGHQPDYMMREKDPILNGTYVGMARTAVVRFSPYNLTADILATSNTMPAVDIQGTVPAVNPGKFTEYPSQGGGIFTANWADAHAWAPYGSISASDFTLLSPAGTYTSPWNSNLYETCPKGYRRPYAGSTYTYDMSAQEKLNIMKEAEMQQSIYVSPDMNGPGYADSNLSIAGYYADGYFDRRKTDTPPNSGMPNSLVSRSTRNVAHSGVVMFNPNKDSYASLFFPYSGGRNSNTPEVSGAGTTGFYFTSSLWEDCRSPMMINFMGYESIFNTLSQWSEADDASSIRCVVDE